MTSEHVRNNIESTDAATRADRIDEAETNSTTADMKVPKMCSETDIAWAKAAWHACLQNCLYGLANYFALMGDEMER